MCIIRNVFVIREKISDVKKEKIPLILYPSPDSWNKTLSLLCHILFHLPAFVSSAVLEQGMFLGEQFFLILLKLTS